MVYQDITIADETGTSSMSAWDKNIDILEPLKSYKFDKVYVRSYRDEKSVTLPQRSEFKLIGDDEVKVLSTLADEKTEIVYNVEIVGTQNFNVHYCCNNCRNKLNIGPGDDSARGSKCGLLQFLKSCDFEVASNLLFQNPDGVIMLKVCTDNIKK